MLVWLCAIFLVLGFIIIGEVIGIIDNGTRVFVVAKQSIGILQDANMDDLVKEKAVQGCAKELIKLFSLITIGSLIALTVLAAQHGPGRVDPRLLMCDIEPLEEGAQS